MVQANVIYTGAQIVAANPQLGAFSAGAVGQASVGVFEPGNRFGDRLNQLDLRFTKIVRMGRSSLDLNVDLYNAFNSDAIITQTSQYGTTWLRPTSSHPGALSQVQRALRLLKGPRRAPQRWMIPRRTARATAAVRSLTPSLVKMFLRWVTTVSSLIDRAAPISLFRFPSATT